MKRVNIMKKMVLFHFQKDKFNKKLKINSKIKILKEMIANFINNKIKADIGKH